jgi:hypothetical protein
VTAPVKDGTPKQDERGDRMTTLKEITATVIAIAILVAFLVTFRGVWNEIGTQGFGPAKDLLQFLTGMFGVVLGYYFGRIPAERAADASKREADDARLRESRTRQQTRDKVRDALDLVQPAGSGPLGGSSLPLDPAATALRALLRDLENAT